ncbi:MAG: lytic transglycosylase domain-containing protein, partial [Bdellovibrionota bacterium]|nr:lytic transglycosylase domain-containing protein [Bdellovibrionota bacterium]
GFDKKVLEILFPTPYFHQIKKEIDKEFDPVIALSLIRQESGFNRRARSRVGARGLMQLMPATARRFKRRLKTSHLYNPSTNINIGTKYFNNLLNRYDNNLVYSLAAYNAGEHRVDRWQSDFLSNDSILKDIENIPFRETRKYVKLIFRNIFFYKMLLKEGGNDEHKYNQIFDLHLGFNR